MSVTYYRAVKGNVTGSLVTGVDRWTEEDYRAGWGGEGRGGQGASTRIHHYLTVTMLL